MGLLSAMDLVIAMPVSWLPLVADYARFGKGGRGAFSGTWIGYAVANVWCYALGVMVASVSAPDADLVNTLLLAQGGLIALSLILVDEIDNAYGDVYSGAVSSHSLLPQWGIRRWGMVLAVLCTGLALVLPMRGLEPFLLILSSVFVPLYGVILGRLGFGAVAATAPSLLPSPLLKVNNLAAGIWIVGIALFQALTTWAPQWGATLPTLALTGVLAFATRRAWVSAADAPWPAVQNRG
jgi:purine-cytosine permease-like protein